MGKRVTVYIDDIQIYTKTFEEHLEVLREVLTRLRKHRLFLKPKKYTFASHEMRYLGFVITKDGLTTDPNKVQDVVNYPQPTSHEPLTIDGSSRISRL